MPKNGKRVFCSWMCASGWAADMRDGVVYRHIDGVPWRKWHERMGLCPYCDAKLPTAPAGAVAAAVA